MTSVRLSDQMPEIFGNNPLGKFSNTRAVSQDGDRRQHVGEHGNQHSRTTYALYNAHLSVAGILERSDTARPVLWNPKCIEHLRSNVVHSHCHTPRTSLSVHNAAFVRCPTLNSLGFGPLLHTKHPGVARRSHTKVFVPELEHVGAAPKHFRDCGINARAA